MISRRQEFRAWQLARIALDDQDLATANEDELATIEALIDLVATKRRDDFVALLAALGITVDPNAAWCAACQPRDKH